MAAAKRSSKTGPRKSPKRGAPSERARKAEFTRLRRRTAELMAGYVSAGEATPKLKQAVRALKSDIDDWRDRTGGTELRATSARLNDNTDPDDWTCDRCDWIMTSMGRICFLVGCDPDYNQCSYICITLPKDPNYPVS